MSKNKTNEKKLFSNFLNELTILIPFYNEEKRINILINKLNELIKKNNEYRNLRFIFVNDGSTDQTYQKLSKELIKLPFTFTIYGYDENMGRGYAERYGVLRVITKYVLITDFDLSTPLTELKRFYKYITDYDMIIGSRWIKPEWVKNIKKRSFTSKISLDLINTVLNLNFTDTQCGFKLFKSNVAKLLYSVSRINRFGISFEILYIAKLANFRIKEVPVHWYYEPMSTVKWHHYLTTLKELIEVKTNTKSYLSDLDKYSNFYF